MKSKAKTPYTFLSKDSIRLIYEGHCVEMEIPFDEDEFEKFLDFLAIDINDWIQGNLRYFNSQERKRFSC